MTEKEWEQFFDLLEKIVDGEGPYKERATELLGKAKAYVALGDLYELVSWLGGEVTE